MNLIFGLVIATAAALFVFAVLMLLPDKFWLLFPKEVDEWRTPVIRILAGLVFLVILATNFATYGPRNELSNATAMPQPQRQAVEVGEEWSDTEDRRGNADELLDEAPVRAPIKDAKDDP